MSKVGIVGLTSCNIDIKLNYFYKKLIFEKKYSDFTHQ